MNDFLIDILSINPTERTLEQKLILLQHDFDELSKENHHLRLCLDGAVALSRSLEKKILEMDQILTWNNKVINQNYTNITKNI